ncbi:MAG: hypothetical protein IPI67_38550 [Myxococcales bacterium]|nr:hypothetical protein [Myxococcales bacterium]
MLIAKYPVAALFFVVAAGCARTEKPRPELSTAAPPLADAATGPELDANLEDENQKGAQQLDAQFEADTQFSAAEVESFRKPIADALAGLKEAPAVSSLECRAKLCRASIEVADEKALAQVYGALTGRPGPGAVRTGRLLTHGLTIARRGPTPDGKYSAQLYFSR